MASEPTEIVIRGKKVQCSHCGWTHFQPRSALLNTLLMTLLDFDWLNRSANVYVCTACGHLEWFLKHPKKSA